MYKHYYMKQYNCIFCAFPILSVCLTSFAPILTTNENWILFLAFLKIMWTIFGCKWHFPSRDTTYDIEHDKKECQERRNWSRRIKVSQEDGQNWSCGSISVFVCIFWTNDLICIIVKTWENISSLSLCVACLATFNQICLHFFLVRNLSLLQGALFLAYSVFELKWYANGCSFLICPLWKAFCWIKTTFSEVSHFFDFGVVSVWNESWDYKM